LSLRFREEYRLTMLENRVPGRIFGCKRDAVTGGWRKLGWRIDSDGMA
jgi:hypothetical protein